MFNKFFIVAPRSFSLHTSLLALAVGATLFAAPSWAVLTDEERATPSASVKPHTKATKEDFIPSQVLPDYFDAGAYLELYPSLSNRWNAKQKTLARMDGKVITDADLKTDTAMARKKAWATQVAKLSLIGDGEMGLPLTARYAIPGFNWHSYLAINPSLEDRFETAQTAAQGVTLTDKDFQSPGMLAKRSLWLQSLAHRSLTGAEPGLPWLPGTPTGFNWKTFLELNPDLADRFSSAQKRKASKQGRVLTEDDLKTAEWLGKRASWLQAVVRATFRGTETGYSWISGVPEGFNWKKILSDYPEVEVAYNKATAGAFKLTRSKWLEGFASWIQTRAVEQHADKPLAEDATTNQRMRWTAAFVNKLVGRGVRFAEELLPMDGLPKPPSALTADSYDDLGPPPPPPGDSDVGSSSTAMAPPPYDAPEPPAVEARVPPAPAPPSFAVIKSDKQSMERAQSDRRMPKVEGLLDGIKFPPQLRKAKTKDGGMMVRARKEAEKTREGLEELIAALEKKRRAQGGLDTQETLQLRAWKTRMAVLEEDDDDEQPGLFGSIEPMPEPGLLPESKKELTGGTSSAVVGAGSETNKKGVVVSLEKPAAKEGSPIVGTPVAPPPPPALSPPKSPAGKKAGPASVSEEGKSPVRKKGAFLLSGEARRADARDKRAALSTAYRDGTIDDNGKDSYRKLLIRTQADLNKAESEDLTRLYLEKKDTERGLAEQEAIALRALLMDAFAIEGHGLIPLFKNALREILQEKEKTAEGLNLIERTALFNLRHPQEEDDDGDADSDDGWGEWDEQDD